MQSIPYIGCTICGIPRDMDAQPDSEFDKHEGPHLWVEMELVRGWNEEVGSES